MIVRSAPPPPNVGKKNMTLFSITKPKRWEIKVVFDFAVQSHVAHAPHTPEHPSVQYR